MYSLFLVALNDNILNSRVINYIYIYIKVVKLNEIEC